MQEKRNVRYAVAAELRRIVGEPVQMEHEMRQARLTKLKKLEAEEAAGLISSGFFVGLLQLGWARGHENAFAAAVDIADRHHNRSVVRLRSGRCDSPAEPK